MEWLTDAALISAYLQAQELNLDKDFLDMIEEEMGNRTLDIHKRSQTLVSL